MLEIAPIFRHFSFLLEAVQPAVEDPGVASPMVSFSGPKSVSTARRPSLGDRTLLDERRMDRSRPRGF
jgi:hypothetical protein